MFIYGIYVLEGEGHPKFSLGDIWNLFQEDLLPNNTSNFWRQMINCMRAWNYLKKTSDLQLNIETIKETHKIMMDGAGEYRKSPVFAGYHIFAPAGHIKRYMGDVIFMFHENKRMIQLWPLQIYLETLSISIHLKVETEEFVA